MTKKIYAFVLKKLRPIIMKTGGSVTVWINDSTTASGRNIYIFWRKNATEWYDAYFAKADLACGWYAITGFRTQEEWEQYADTINIRKIKVHLGA